MSEERKKILEMLSEGKITVQEAEKLLEALSGTKDRPETRTSGPKYLRVMVEPSPENKGGDRINIRVPLKLLKAGLKLASFIPKDARSHVNEALHEKGIDMDFDKIKPEDLENIISQLNDLTVDVEGKETVKVFCE